MRAEQRFIIELEEVYRKERLYECTVSVGSVLLTVQAVKNMTVKGRWS